MDCRHKSGPARVRSAAHLYEFSVTREFGTTVEVSDVKQTTMQSLGVLRGADLGGWSYPSTIGSRYL